MSETETQSTVPPTPPRRKATVRLSQSELNRISFGVIVCVAAVLGFLGYRAMLGFKASHDLQIARQNLHMLHEAFYNYAQDWDGHLPPADHWTDAVAGYLSSSGQPGGALASLHGPGDTGTIGYVCNDLAAGYNPESGKHDASHDAPLDAQRRAINPSQLVLLIERPHAEANAHTLIPPQNNREAEKALYKELAFPHGADDTDAAATVVLYADGSQRTWIRHDFKQ